MKAPKLNSTSSEKIRASPCISITPQTEHESDLVADAVIVDKRFYFLSPF
jgi:hypothetical protein